MYKADGMVAIQRWGSSSGDADTLGAEKGFWWRHGFAILLPFVALRAMFCNAVVDLSQ
jgi:hypothetical protein